MGSAEGQALCRGRGVVPHQTFRASECEEQRSSGRVTQGPQRPDLRAASPPLSGPPQERNDTECYKMIQRKRLSLVPRSYSRSPRCRSRARHGYTGGPSSVEQPKGTSELPSVRPELVEACPEPVEGGSTNGLRGAPSLSLPLLLRASATCSEVPYGERQLDPARRAILTAASDRAR